MNKNIKKHYFMSTDSKLKIISFTLTGTEFRLEEGTALPLFTLKQCLSPLYPNGLQVKGKGGLIAPRAKGVTELIPALASSNPPFYPNEVLRGKAPSKKVFSSYPLLLTPLYPFLPERSERRVPKGKGLERSFIPSAVPLHSFLLEEVGVKRVKSGLGEGAGASPLALDSAPLHSVWVERVKMRRTGKSWLPQANKASLCNTLKQGSKVILKSNNLVFFSLPLLKSFHKSKRPNFLDYNMWVDITTFYNPPRGDRSFIPFYPEGGGDLAKGKGGRGVVVAPHSPKSLFTLFTPTSKLGALPFLPSLSERSFIPFGDLGEGQVKSKKKCINPFWGSGALPQETECRGKSEGIKLCSNPSLPFLPLGQTGKQIVPPFPKYPKLGALPLVKGIKLLSNPSFYPFYNPPRGDRNFIPFLSPSGDSLRVKRDLVQGNYSEGGVSKDRASKKGVKGITLLLSANRSAFSSKNALNQNNLSYYNYHLDTYHRSNQDTCLLDKPAVKEGDWVQSGDLLSDSASSVGGELAIGHNIIVAYMPWEGYNYEDAILINQRLVYEDIYTSIHIERYEIETKETKQGPEQITRELPDVSSNSISHLDKHGIARIGSWVEEGHILVGKVTPFDTKTYTANEKFIFELFNKKLSRAKDSSLRAPKGIKAHVINVNILNRQKLDEANVFSLKAKGLRGKDPIPAKPTAGGLGVTKIPPFYNPSLGDKSLYPLTGAATLLQRGRGDRSFGGLAKQGLKSKSSNPPLLLFPQSPLDGALPFSKTPSSKGVNRIKKVGEKGNKPVPVPVTNISLFPFLPKLHPFIPEPVRAGGFSEGLTPTGFRVEGGKMRVGKSITGSNSNKTKTKKGKKVLRPSNVHIYLAEKRKIQVGDKMAGRHGNKGIVSRILPRQDMPFLPDGTPVDIVLNPLGVPSRMNVGQIYECLLGLAGRFLGEHYKIPPFDEIYGAEASRSFVFSKLYEARKKTGLEWLFDPNNPGKIRLFDGRTSDSFDQTVTVGIAYVLKLVHMVDDKLHFRSTGPYSLVTQQPLRGRSKQGGQRLGEMEVWAIEGYGAAFVLSEMLTIKSDNMSGRQTLWVNLINNKEISLGTPESFKVLVCELQALCLDIGLFRQNPVKMDKGFSSSTINKNIEIDSLLHLA